MKKRISNNHVSCFMYTRFTSHPEALGFLRKVAREIKPTYVMCLGDELDQYTLSKYPHDPDAQSAGDEYKEAMRFWKGVYNLFPDARAVTSNHVQRVAKRAIESGIPSAYLRSVEQFMQAPKGWKWRDEWVVDGVKYEHGERAGGITGLRNLVIANMRSTVIGHQHECPGTTFVSNGSTLLWGLNVGCLVSSDSYGLSYTKRNRHKPVLGCGVVMDGVPAFYPM
jgi:hypothetical protein